jgi:DNA-binding CsgD family transcriptional regulator
MRAENHAENTAALDTVGMDNFAGDSGAPDTACLAEQLARQLLGQLRRDPRITSETGGVAQHPAGGAVLMDIRIADMRCLVLHNQDVHEPLRVLSEREREIVALVASGHPDKTIAALLQISRWTVNTYLRRIFEKLNVSTRSAMIARLSQGSWTLE